MKSEMTITASVLLPNSAPAPSAETSPIVRDHVSSSPEVRCTGITPTKRPTTSATSWKSKIPVRTESKLNTPVSLV